jgi:hypothetical protein
MTSKRSSGAEFINIYDQIRYYLVQWFPHFFSGPTIEIQKKNISRTIYCFTLIIIGGVTGAFFGIAISENVHILYLIPIKFYPRFSPWPPKEIMLSSPMLTTESV